MSARNLPEFQSFVLRNVQEFKKKHPELGSKLLTVYVESNGRYDGGSVAQILTDFVNMTDCAHTVPPVRFAQSDSIKRKGIIKTAPISTQYILFFQTALEMNAISIHENVSTASTVSTAKVIVSEMVDELCRYVWPDMDAGNPRYGSRISKATGKFDGYSDDLAVAALMFVYFALAEKNIRTRLKHYRDERSSAHPLELI